MTSNEEMAEKLAEKFYGLIEGDVSVSGGELAKLFVTALDQAGLALSEKAKAYISFEPVLPNGKTLADMFASSDRKPLGTVIDGEGPMLPDGCHAPADETDARNEERRHLERMLRTADRAYEELSLLANHFHHERDHDGFIRAHGAAVSAHTIALTLSSRLDEEKEGDD